MKFDAYAEACLPETYTILGLTLKPLCLGHYILMKRLGSNYASDEITDISVADFLLAVLICSMSYEECLRFFSLPPQGFFSWENIKSFGRAYFLTNKLGPTGYEIHLWGKQFTKQISKSKDFNLLIAMQRFQTYIKDSTTLPYYFETPNTGDGKQSGAHWSISLKMFLLTKYNESESLNLPLRQAFYEYCKWAEEQGSIELFQPFEEEMLATP